MTTSKSLIRPKRTGAGAGGERARQAVVRPHVNVLYQAGAATQPDYDDSRAQEQSTQAAVDSAKAQSPKRNSR